MPAESAPGRLDLGPFLEYLDAHTPDPGPFRAWVARAEGRAVGAVEAAAGLAPVGGDGAGDGLTGTVPVPCPVSSAARRAPSGSPDARPV